MTTLRVEDLGVRFAGRAGAGADAAGGVTAVESVSFEVEGGRILALVGESGSGKSVTLQAILGLLDDSARVRGRALLDGTDLTSASRTELRRLRGGTVAIVFQDPMSALHPLHRIGRQLVEAVTAHRAVGRREARERAARALEVVGLDPALLDRYPHELSGGMRQRALIAMAIVNEPRVLLADEPTTALDVTVQAGILEVLTGIRDRLGTAIVLVTHDLGVVAEVADDVVVMRAGRVVEAGSVFDVFERPAEEYTRQLLAARPRLDTAPGPTPDASGSYAAAANTDRDGRRSG